MTCSIRYCRSRQPEDVGLIIVKRTESAAYKARLEASGYVVLDTLVTPPLKSSAENSS